MRLLLVALCLSLSTASAEVYRSVGKDGTVIYSDRPSQGAESIEMAPTSSYAPPPLPRFGSTESTAAEDTGNQDVVAYRSFGVEIPAAGEAVRENAGNVEFSFAVEPPLQDGHSIRVLLDGSPVMNVSDASGRLENIDRGLHTLGGELIDENGRVLERSDAVQFQLLRFHLVPNS